MTNNYALFIHTKHLIGLSFLMLSISCCKKDNVDPQLPPITQTGENTFGMLVNGELYLPSQGLFGAPAIASDYTFNGKIAGTFRLSANRLPEDGGGSLDIIFHNQIFDTGYFPLVENHPRDAICYVDTVIGLCPNVLDPNNTGYLHLTRLDTVNHIISGTFSFDMLRKKDSTRISITQGRFDLDWWRH